MLIGIETEVINEIITFIKAKGGVVLCFYHI